MKATLVETFRWSGSSKLRGFVLDTEAGVRLPGMITVDLDTPHPGKAVAEYFTSYVTFSKPEAPIHTPNNRVIVGTHGNTTYGPWADADEHEVLAAIVSAIHMLTQSISPPSDSTPSA
jgi:hypothetical protein